MISFGFSKINFGEQFDLLHLHICNCWTLTEALAEESSADCTDARLPGLLLLQTRVELFAQLLHILPCGRFTRHLHIYFQHNLLTLQHCMQGTTVGSPNPLPTSFLLPPPAHRNLCFNLKGRERDREKLQMLTKKYGSDSLKDGSLNGKVRRKRKKDGHAAYSARKMSWRCGISSCSRNWSLQKLPP